MRLRRHVGRVAAWLLLAAPALGVLGAVSVQHEIARSPGTARPTRTGHVVVALGDSVPSGRACACRPFPEAYGTLLSKRTGVPVTVENRAASGLQTADVLVQLRDPEVEEAVRRADVVLVTIGANDFGDHHDDVVGGTCGPEGIDCVSDELAAMRSHLAAALARIRGLRDDAPTTVLVTGYWNVFEAGDVARRSSGTAGLEASLRLTRKVNAVIESVTTAAGAQYVDLYRPFEQSGRNVTALMAGDGDHPNAAGHRLIARVLLRAGLPRMR
jgi:lysophospholipase L1-like esterase